MKKLYILLTLVLIANYNCVKASNYPPKAGKYSTRFPMAQKQPTALNTLMRNRKRTRLPQATNFNSPQLTTKRTIETSPASKPEDPTKKSNLFDQIEYAPIDQVAAAVKVLATQKEHFEEDTRTTFTPINKAFESKEYTDVTLTKNVEEGITVILHKNPQAGATDKTFKLNEKNSQEFETMLFSLLRKRSQRQKFQGAPGAPQEFAPSSIGRRIGSRDDDDDDYDYEPRQRPVRNSPQQASKSSKPQQAQSGMPGQHSRGFSHHPAYGGGVHHMPQYYGRPGRNAQPISVGGATRPKIAFAQHGPAGRPIMPGRPAAPVKKQKVEEEAEPVKGITRVMSTTETRVPEPETRISKRIHATPQNFEHKRRTERTSKLVRKDTQEKPAASEQDKPRPAPVKLHKPGIMTRTYNTVSEWLSYMWNVLKSPFVSKK